MKATNAGDDKKMKLRKTCDSKREEREKEGEE
mgnify:CR=1 FL=1